MSALVEAIKGGWKNITSAATAASLAWTFLNIGKAIFLMTSVGNAHSELTIRNEEHKDHKQSEDKIYDFSQKISIKRNSLFSSFLPLGYKTHKPTFRSPQHMTLYFDAIAKGEYIKDKGRFFNTFSTEKNLHGLQLTLDEDNVPSWTVPASTSLPFAQLINWLVRGVLFFMPKSQKLTQAYRKHITSGIYDKPTPLWQAYVDGIENCKVNTKNKEPMQTISWWTYRSKKTAAPAQNADQLKQKFTKLCLNNPNTGAGLNLHQLTKSDSRYFAAMVKRIKPEAVNLSFNNLNNWDTEALATTIAATKETTLYSGKGDECLSKDQLTALFQKLCEINRNNIKKEGVQLRVSQKDIHSNKEVYEKFAKKLNEKGIKIYVGDADEDEHSKPFDEKTANRYQETIAELVGKNLIETQQSITARQQADEQLSRLDAKTLMNGQSFGQVAFENAEDFEKFIGNTKDKEVQQAKNKEFANTFKIHNTRLSLFRARFTKRTGRGSVPAIEAQSTAKPTREIKDGTPASAPQPHRPDISGQSSAPTPKKRSTFSFLKMRGAT